ncbi:MAG: pyruvate dehydrogenase complex dihydrolipoamide acetyltransferase [Gemmatimonadota bacterium]|nr:MAG: pyruvate dehydrogenase complex dihydrolipoamide acetyltransferase [Gemmatimonadota bacterium]
MATKVHMEALSPTMEEGQVVKWLKAEGDPVTAGEILAEIETDKATMELVARGDGLLRKILVGEGGTAPVGDVIAVIGSADEDVSEFGSSGGEASSASSPAPEASEVTEVESAPAEAEAPETIAAPGLDRAANGRIKASPVARRLAEEAGLDLASVAGSGPGGRIVKRDVEAALEGGVPAAPARTPTPLTAVPPVSDADYEDIPLTQMRKTIARRLVESIGPVPHFFLTVNVDMTRALEARQRINSMLEAEGRKTSINDLIIRATAAALRRHPDCNAHWMGDSVRRFNRVHIGVAVAIDDGLITPVIRDAHMKGVADIGAEVRELAGRAREKKLMPDEYTGATFSISNLGMLGIHEFTAVINPPEAGILAVGAVEDTPVVVEGEIHVRPRMRITMSCDHRVIDGALGARFLATLRGMLEEPAAILM